MDDGRMDDGHCEEDVAAMEAAHAEDKAALLAEFEALKAVVVSALGEEGVAEAIGNEAESAAARLRAADDGVARVLLISVGSSAHPIICDCLIMEYPVHSEVVPLASFVHSLTRLFVTV